MLFKNIQNIELFTFIECVILFFITDSELVRLPEDAALSGFTPLMANENVPIYTDKNNDMVIHLFFSIVCVLSKDFIIKFEFLFGFNKKY